jgi:hypothetical protein
VLSLAAATKRKEENETKKMKPPEGQNEQKRKNEKSPANHAANVTTASSPCSLQIQGSLPSPPIPPDGVAPPSQTITVVDHAQ